MEHLASAIHSKDLGTPSPPATRLDSFIAARPVSLRTRTLITISAISVSLTLILFLFALVSVDGGYTTLENDQVAQDVGRAENAIDGEVARIVAIAGAWGSAPELVAFMRTHDTTLLDRAYPDDRFSASEINIMLLLDSDGRVVEHRYVNLEYGHRMPTPKSLLAQLAGHPRLVNRTPGGASASGLIELYSGPMMLAAQAIQGDASGCGTIILGRYLDSVEIAQLSARTELPFTVTPLNGKAMNPTLSSAVERLKGGEAAVVMPVDNELIRGYGLLSDLSGVPVLALTIEEGRGIHQRGQASLGYLLLSLLLIGLVFGGMTMFLLERTVLSRLAVLATRITTITQSGRLSSRIAFEGSDEIASVAGRINDMLGSLERSQALIRAHQERYGRLVEESRDLFFTIDSAGRLTAVNRTAESLTGYDRAALIGRDLSVLFAEDDQPTVRSWLAAIHTHEGHHAGLARIITHDGIERLIEVRAQPEFDLARHRPIGIFCVARDVTERELARAELARHRDRLEEIVDERTAQLAEEVAVRRGAERSLAEQKERLAVTLASIADGVITTDTDGCVTLMNAVAASLLGISVEEALGRPIGEVLRLVDTVRREPIETPAREVLLRGEVVEHAHGLGLRDRDGSERPIVLSAAPIEDEERHRFGAVLVFRDITDRLRFEEEQARTQRLESLGVLAGGIAHDFNNILTAITGNLALAKLDVDPDHPVFGCLEDAEAATMRAREVTRQLITFAKGGAPVKRTVVIGELVRETAAFVARATRSKLEFDLHDSLWSADVDEGQITQVINNLVINADQAMPDGGRITVTVENVTLSAPEESLPAGEYVRCRVKDEGVGIPSERLARIFEPYYTTKKAGNGLGLASVVSIVRRHGGYITVSSEIGIGTQFSVYLPRSSGALDAPRISELPEAKGSDRILLMDDDHAILSTIGPLLRRRGYTVVTAEDGAGAIERYREATASGVPFDAVVMDLTVPGGMGGLEATRQILALDPGARVIVSSGYSDAPVMADHRRYGFADVLPKPYRIEELVWMLRGLMEEG